MSDSLRSYLQSIALGLVFILGAGTTIWGFVQMHQQQSYHPSWENIPLTAASLLAVVFAVDVFSRWSNINRLVVGILTVVAITIFTGTLWPLLVTIGFAFASFVVGNYILSFLRIDKEYLSGINSFLTGVGFYGTGAGLLAHFPVNYPGLYGIALVVPIILGRRLIYAAVQSLGKFLVPSPKYRFLDLAIVVFALLHFLVSLMPEVGHDALMMHLFVPGQMAINHEWGFDVVTYAWAVIPMLGDWLYSIGYLLAGETAARFINTGFVFVLCWLIRDLVIWAGGNALGTRWGVLLFLSTPLAFLESSSAFIEPVWTAFIVAGALSVFKIIGSNDNKQKPFLLLAGLFFGLGLAAKAVSFTILPVFSLLLLFRWRTWAKFNLRGTIGLGVILFLVFGSIPYLTAWWMTGNPVFPFFNKVFQSPLWWARNFEQNEVFGKGLSWDVLYQATFHSQHFLESKPGAVGFQWLLLLSPAFLILLMSRYRKAIILFVVAVLSVALTFQGTAYLRYVFPAFIWVSAGIGVAFSASYAKRFLRPRLLIAFGCAVIFLNFFFLKSATWYGQISLQPLISQQGRVEYLNSRLPIRNATELVNNLNVERTPVAVFSYPLIAGLSADIFHPDWDNPRFQEKIAETRTSEEMAVVLSDSRIDYIILDSNWYQRDKQLMIEAVSEKIAEFGDLAIWKFRKDLRFQTELLMNPDFDSFAGWHLPSTIADQIPGQVTSRITEPTKQFIPVVPGQRYLNSVTALCYQEPTQGRVQVNWLDSNSDFLTTNISVFDCTKTETTHEMEVTAPPGAYMAVVYASGHTNTPIIIKRVSFKK